MEVATRGRPEHRHQRPLGQRRHVGHGPDAAVGQLAGRDPPDPPQAPHRQRVEEGQLVGRRDHQQAVGLGHLAGHLGQELGARHAHRDREPHPLAHLAPQPGGDVGRRPGQAPQAADVEEGLVDRQGLDQRRGVVEDGERGLAGLRVGRHPRRDHHRRRAQPPGLGPAHRRAHAARLGLVARRQHDPAADDDRPPPQARVVALLDRRVEGVEVGVEDGGAPRARVGHVRMFA
jgi:hypothetical protein